MAIQLIFKLVAACAAVAQVGYYGTEAKRYKCQINRAK